MTQNGVVKVSEIEEATNETELHKLLVKNIRNFYIKTVLFNNF